MTDTSRPAEFSEDAAPADRPNKTGRGRQHAWQWSLLMLLLLMAAAAAWLATWSLWQQNRQLREEIAQMQQLTRKLVVLEPDQMAVVDEEEQWYDDDDWQVYLPPNHRYVLRLATRRIPIRDDEPPQSAAEVVVSPGYHGISLDEQKHGEQWLLTVLVDGRVVMKVPEDAQWDPGEGTSSLAPRKETQQIPLDQIMLLEKDRFHQRMTGGVSSPPDGSTNGLMLWIEADP